MFLYHLLYGLDYLSIMRDVFSQEIIFSYEILHGFHIHYERNLHDGFDPLKININSDHFQDVSQQDFFAHTKYSLLRIKGNPIFFTLLENMFYMKYVI